MDLIKLKSFAAAGTAVLLLAGCQTGTETKEKEDTSQTEQTNTGNEHGEQQDHSQGNSPHEMHSSSGEVPVSLKKEDNPKYPIGSKVMMHADHMPGMEGVSATVSGAFDTTAYSVTYTPTDGGEPVHDHKWVIHEELANPGDAPLKPGTEVKLEADHMPGMDGADARIDSAVETTVYMVDFVPEDAENEVKNHKWVIEDELSAN